MPTLRNRLESDSPELFAALLRSWEIAQKEWLPAVSPSEGSYNSLPHFKNIEHHLDSLLSSAGECPTTIRLSTLDVYLLLSAVLFHDFGRVYGDADHAAASARSLPEHFAALGIPTRELALSLSRIALYHDPVTAKDKEDNRTMEKLKRAKESLRDVRIEDSETRWVFAPRDAWTTGDYSLTALPALEDASGNRIGRAATGRDAGTDLVRIA